MRFLIVAAMTATLFMSTNANAFFGCFQRMAGGMANINSGTCNNPANGLWSSYCNQGAHTSYGYGGGFGAYAWSVPPARSCNTCSSCMGFGGIRGGCGSGAASCGGGIASSCGGGCNLGANLRSFFGHMRSRCCSAGSCCSTGSTWVGGGPLDAYSPAPSAGVFEGGVDYGYIDSCGAGGCGGGCSDGGYSDGGYSVDAGASMGGEVITHSEAPVVIDSGAPAVDAAAPAADAMAH